MPNDKTPEEDAVHVEEEAPLHRDPQAPPRFPKATWAKMDSEQKENYLKFVRGYLQDLEDERRSDIRRKHGY